jgi:hypothetical protein
MQTDLQIWRPVDAGERAEWLPKSRHQVQAYDLALCIRRGLDTHGPIDALLTCTGAAEALRGRSQERCAKPGESKPQLQCRGGCRYTYSRLGVWQVRWDRMRNFSYHSSIVAYHQGIHRRN